MTNTTEKQTPSFKVVDKRSSYQDENVASAAKNESVKPQQENSKSQEKSTAKTENTPKKRPELTFSLFIQSLASQAFMQMGLIPSPDSGIIKADLTAAKETTDILVLLHEKTKGNLTAEEAKLFDTVLYELRMTYLKVVQGNFTAPTATNMPSDLNIKK